MQRILIPVFCLLAVILPLGAFAQDAEMAKKSALVSRYVNEEHYPNLYDQVVAQYTSILPSGEKREQMQERAADPLFRKRLFGAVQDEVAKTYTMDELAAMQHFIDTPEGKSISKKVDALGLLMRNKDLDENERAALRRFHDSDQGRSIATKGVGFASRAMSLVLQAVVANRFPQ